MSEILGEIEWDMNGETVSATLDREGRWSCPKVPRAEEVLPVLAENYAHQPWMGDYDRRLLRYLALGLKGRVVRLPPVAKLSPGCIP